MADDSENASVKMPGSRRFMRQKAKILVMDSQVPTAMLMVYLLTRAGFDATAAHHGHKGFDLAKENKFDLIALDTDLPGLNGFDICSELKQRHISHQTPIIFVSGRAGYEDRRRAFELGAADFITKPFEAEDFLSRMHSQLEHLV